jgi:simple sugar transport system substrate-binding protein
METIKQVLAGQTVEKWIKTKESDFLAADAAAALPNRKY